ncbi:MAG: hypothetical protein IKA79_03725 [Lentisphaeria bacterium]|nr:hypothetical protein [Lentisphaeria bacterium]
MAICERVHTDLNISGKTDPENIDLVYLVIGVDDEFEARDLVLNTAPEIFRNCTRDIVELDKHEGTALYFRVSYVRNGTEKEEDEDEDEISFDLSSSSVTMKRAYSQTSYGSNAPDAGLSIGWNGKSGDQSDIAGVEVSTSTIRKSFTVAMKYKDLTVAWEKKVAKLFGKVNSSSWKGYEAGEVLFLGCSFSGINSKKTVFNVTYNFGIAFNEKNVLIGKDSNNREIRIDKTGWQYVWDIVKSEYAESKKDMPPAIRIMGVYVANVYKTADLNALGI